MSSAATSSQSAGSTSTTPARRIREVTPRRFIEAGNECNLIGVWFEAIHVHKRMHDDAKMLHGDINMNTIIVFEFDGPVPEGGRSARGGLVYFDPPMDVKKAALSTGR